MTGFTAKHQGYARLAEFVRDIATVQKDAQLADLDGDRLMVSGEEAKRILNEAADVIEELILGSVAALEASPTLSPQTKELPDGE